MFCQSHSLVGQISSVALYRTTVMCSVLGNFEKFSLTNITDQYDKLHHVEFANIALFIPNVIHMLWRLLILRAHLLILSTANFKSICSCIFNCINSVLYMLCKSVYLEKASKSLFFFLFFSSSTMNF